MTHGTPPPIPPQQPTGYPPPPGYPPAQGYPPAYPPPPYPSVAPVPYATPGYAAPAYIPPTPPYALPPLPPIDEGKLRSKLFGGWGATLGIGVMLVIGLILYAVLAHDLYRDHRYKTVGVTVDGHVVKVHTTTSTSRRGGKSYTYYVDYRFADRNGGLHSDEESVGSEIQNDFASQLRRSGPVPVKIQYLPDDPDVNRLLRERSEGGHVALGLFATALAGGAAAWWHFGRRRAARRARVVFHGTPVPGQVLVSETRGAGKGTRHVFQYRYVGLDGAEQVSKQQNVTADQRNRFPAGSIIPVLIDPNDPTRPEPDLYGARAAG